MNQDEAEKAWYEDKNDPDVYQERNKKGELTVACEMPVELSRSDARIERKEKRIGVPEADIWLAEPWS